MAAPALSLEDHSSLTTRRMRTLLDRQRRACLSEGPPSRELRVQRLERLIASVIEHEEPIVEALVSDFGHRSRDASRLSDVAGVIESAKYCKKHLASWLKPERRGALFPFNLLGAKAEVQYQPLGVVGLVTPWNYPVYTALSPLAQVLAAGNRALIKPSEIAPASAGVIADIIGKAFDEVEVAVIAGDPDVGAAFTRLPLDHLMFTGSGAIARQAMRAAADNLVPVTLELGGKSPVIVGADANLKDVALKVMDGKCLNAGQRCVAPDYVLVPAQRRTELVEALHLATAKLFDGVRDNPDYTSMINEAHYRRVQSLLDDARDKGAKIVEINPRGESFEGQPTHKLPPTLVLDPTDDMAVLQEEIFGPVLPIKTYGNIDDAIDYINRHDRPLGIYYFGHDGVERERVLSRTTSGGVTVNDVAMHAIQNDLPFGGVGASGTGAFHGKEGFRAFSHARAVYTQTNFDFLGQLLRPPYGAKYRKLVAGMVKA